MLYLANLWPATGRGQAIADQAGSGWAGSHLRENPRPAGQHGLHQEVPGWDSRSFSL